MSSRRSSKSINLRAVERRARRAARKHQPGVKGIRGGAQPGGGRPKGAKNRSTYTSLERLTERDDAPKITPLEVLEEAMQHYYGVYKFAQRKVDEGDKYYADIAITALASAAAFAKDAAPYRHAKLQSTELKNPDDGSAFRVQVVDDIPRPNAAGKSSRQHSPGV